MTSHIYKVCSRPEWDAARQNGSYAGSAVDAADGFIHFSTADQLDETLGRHFKGQTDLVALIVPLGALESADLRWEPSRGGDLFPHLYSALPVSAVEKAISLIDGADGVPGLPDGAKDG